LALLLLISAPLLVRGNNNDETQESDLALRSTCYQATDCSSCLQTVGACTWCGSSDDSGFCNYCPNNQTCGCTSYSSDIICPDAAKDLAKGLALSVAAIIFIVVGSLVGCCCLLAILTGLVFCLCCRTRAHRGYVVAGQHHLPMDDFVHQHPMDDIGKGRV
jgi:hypothetical protein